MTLETSTILDILLKISSSLDEIKALLVSIESEMKKDHISRPILDDSIIHVPWWVGSQVQRTAPDGNYFDVQSFNITATSNAETDIR